MAFAALLGESHVLSGSNQCQAYEVDGRVPQCVVFPSSAEQVAAVLRLAAERTLGVIPCSHLTRISTGPMPSRYDVAVCLKKMNRITYYEAADLVVSTEAGMRLGDLQEFVGRDKLWLPLDPPPRSGASVGGTLAANASGPLRQLYGSARDMVLGMQIATVEGKIIRAGGRVVKNVAGYDLAKLLIGSYGTLGVIVEVTFKLYPVLSNRTTFTFPAGTLGIARDLRRRIQESALEPMRLVLLDAEAATLLRPDQPGAMSSREPEIWIEAGGSDRVIERYARTLDDLCGGAGIGIKREQAEIALSLWSRLADLQSVLGTSYPQLVILKAVLPIAASEQLVSQVRQICDHSGLRLATAALVGVGVVHLYLLEGSSTDDLPGLIGRLRNASASLGGALVIERCPTAIKPQVDMWGPPGDDLKMMQKVKQAWDPKGILAPGRVISG
jgi:glycolate oxidase FAD binding subunit